MRRPALVEVTWLDACLWSDDYDLDKVSEGCPLRERTTSGYIVKEADEILYVASTIDMKEDPPQCSGVWTIPRGWVKKVTRKRQSRSKKCNSTTSNTKPSSAS